MHRIYRPCPLQLQQVSYLSRLPSTRTLTTTVNYLAPIEKLVPPVQPFRYAYPPPKGVPEHNEVLEPHQVEINDIRRRLSDFGLDQSGFTAWLDTPTSFDKWNDDKAIRSRYYEETIQLIKAKLGATRVIIFDHTIRRRNPDTDDLPDKLGKRQPVYRVHVDQTPAAGQARIRSHTDPERTERLLRTRAQILNIWRPMRGPVVDAPLGLIDVRSVRNKDLVIARILYRDREGSTFLVHHNPHHKWYYLSDMQPDEVVIIKCYDNKLPNTVAPHCSFITASSIGVPVLPRHSIEVRCLVFYENEAVC